MKAVTSGRMGMCSVLGLKPWTRRVWQALAGFFIGLGHTSASKASTNRGGRFSLIRRRGSLLKPWAGLPSACKSLKLSEDGPRPSVESIHERASNVWGAFAPLAACLNNKLQETQSTFNILHGRNSKFTK